MTSVLPFPTALEAHRTELETSAIWIPRDPKLDWGSSDYDIRHRVALSMIWETPWAKNGTGWTHQALGGYTVVPVFTARSGTPFSIFDTTFSENAGSGFGIPRY